MKHLTVTGPAAAIIERGIRSSYYGINGNTPDAVAASAAAAKAIREHLDAEGVTWDTWHLFDARIVNTEGTKTPYKVELFYRVEEAIP